MKLIQTDNLSEAWAKGFLYQLSSTDGIGETMVTEIIGLSNTIVQESKNLRAALDMFLVKAGKLDCEGVANTIFPVRIWNRAAPRSILFERYDKLWPKVRTHRIGRHMPNKFGVYFRRLTAYESGDKLVNQLEHVIETWHKGNHRHSALQAAIFHPAQDHVHNRQRGFPCMQQVSFTPVGQNGAGGLVVTGFYPTQYLVEKAYGNYLGLARLGQFMAHEMGLELAKVQCVAVKPAIGGWPKKSLAALRAMVEGVLGNSGDGATMPPDRVSVSDQSDRQ